MDYKDRAEFAKKMLEMAAIVQRPLEDDDIAAFFNHLKEYPLSLVCEAMDKALRDRDPNDRFMKNLLVTVPEIWEAINGILNNENKGLEVGCDECNNTGWLLQEREGTAGLAIKCKCLLAAIAARKKAAGKTDNG